MYNEMREKALYARRAKFHSGAGNLQPGRTQILDAATRVFSEKGFHRATIKTLLVLQVSLMEQFIHTLPVKRMYCWEFLRA